MGKLDHLKIRRAPAAFSGWAEQFNQQVDLLGSIQGGPGIDVQIAHSARNASTSGSHKPNEQPRGKILFSLRPTAIQGIGLLGAGQGGNSNTNYVNVNVVSSAGTIATLSVPGASLSFVYPNSLYAQIGNSIAGILGYGAVQVANGVRTGIFSADDGLYYTKGIGANTSIDTIGVAVSNGSIQVLDGVTPKSIMDRNGVGVNISGVAVNMNSTGVWVAKATNYGYVRDVSFGGVYGSRTVFANPTGLFIFDGTNAVTIDFGLILRNMDIREIDVCNNGNAAKMLIIGSAPY